MKKLLCICVTLCLLVSAIPASAFNVTFHKPVENVNLDIPKQELVVENGTCAFQAEELTLGADATTVSDKEASGGMAVTTTGVKFTNDHTKVKNETLKIKIKVPEAEKGTYKFWLRIKCVDSLAYSYFHKYTGGSTDYATKTFTVHPTYYWRCLTTVDITNKIDEFEYYIKYRDTGFMLDRFVFTQDIYFDPSGADDMPLYLPGLEHSISYPEPPVTPPLGVHPRLLATKEIIPGLKAKMQHPVLKPMYEQVVAYGNKEINAKMPAGVKNNVNWNTLYEIQSRAYLYLLGEVSKKHARQTVQYMKEMHASLEWDRSVGDITRTMGSVLAVTAQVYDWCYDVLTDDDKAVLIRYIKGLASRQEIGYPTTTKETFAGHGGEGDAFYHQLSAAIAIYDEDPEMYNFVAGMLFDVAYETREYFNATGNHPAGSDYGPVRAAWEQLSAIVFDRMGYPDVMGNQVDKIPMKFIYTRLPHGKWAKDGDTYLSWDRTEGPTYNNNDYASMLYGSYFNNNQYLRGEYIKQLSLKNYSGGVSLYDNGILTLLLLDPESGYKYPDDKGSELPLSYSTSYPMTSMTARTSWRSGVEGETAVVFMNGQEKLVGDHDHDHSDIGHFSIYYKGSLTEQGGYYDSWGSPHYFNYYRRSVSHNCMTVFDPSESFTAYYGKYNQTGGGDGGQQIEKNSENLGEFLSHPDHAKTEGKYIGPNEETPEFTYLKTNLTDAYTDKVTGYTRSMVAMNLFNTDYPLAFVCYDNISSRDAGFKKTWNLQSYKEPKVNGKTTVITRDDYDFSGKLVVKTMLPSDAVISKVGGKGYESWVQGTNYASITKKPDYEEHEWRIEISPDKSANDDVFLNAMYVTDTNKNLPELPMIQEDMESFVGVTVMDRTVLFSKTRDSADSGFSFNVRENGYDKMSVLITDVTAGKWKITGDGTEIVAQVSEEENALYARLAPGSYTASKVADDIDVTPFEYKRDERALTLGDFHMYNTGRKLFMYNEEPTVIKDGVPYISEAEFKALGVEITKNGNTVTMKKETNETILTIGSCEAVQNGKNVTLANAPFIDEKGVLYIAPLSHTRLLGYTIKYDDFARIMKLTRVASVKEINIDADDEKIKQPVKYSASSDDGNAPVNLFDYNLNTRWSARSNHEYLEFDFGEEIDVDMMYLAFYCGNERSTKFDIEVSNDGFNFKKVYFGQSSGQSEEPEKFDFDAKGRYFRLNFYGNSTDLWNSITEIVTVTK